MKTNLLKLSALAITGALLTTSFAEISPLQTGSENAGPWAARETGEPELFAQNLMRTIETQTTLIHYQATERQRRIAEQRARAYQARIAKATTVTKTEKPAPKTATSKTEPKTKTTAKKAEPEPKTTANLKKKTRYIAIDTEKDERASPKAKKVVMIWDTETEKLVGNNVYDVVAPPPVGGTAKFDTYSAEYVGTGG